MDVDFDRAWLRLKAHIGEKRSHGQDELFRVMSEIEIECATDPTISQHTTGRSVGGTPLASPDGMPRTATPLAPKEGANGRREQQKQQAVGPRA